jgi:hypothetical protein
MKGDFGIGGGYYTRIMKKTLKVCEALRVKWEGKPSKSLHPKLWGRPLVTPSGFGSSAGFALAMR